tara:strand:+ start:832 stop:1974 length:1143 start_codon:yes stop_codon:yes gene_type:complete
VAARTIKLTEVENVQGSLASKLKSARTLTGMSTRAVAKQLSKGFSISHATIANYESGKTVPPIDILASLAHLYDRPLNWFLERSQSLTGVRYRNLKSRVRSAELHQFEANVQRWIDAYVSVEQRLNKTLKSSTCKIKNQRKLAPDALSRSVRETLGLSSEDPISSVVELLEAFGIRVLEEPTDLRIDGLAARYSDEYVVILNPTVSNDRVRLNAAHELAHVLFGDCDSDEAESKVMENRAFLFASHLLLPNNQLKQAFTGKSMVRLVQFKEKFGISLAAMVYRAEKLNFITKDQAKKLWIEFSRRGWRNNEPGYVRPDRATRFEQLVEEILESGKMSIKEVSDLAGVRPEEIRDRLNLAIGIPSVLASQEDEAQTIKFPQ